MRNRKGVLILTEGRSGSNWLGSLTTNAGLGHSSEWLTREHSGMNPRTTDRETYFETVLDKATSGATGFCVKIFPHHLYMIHRFYEEDFIRYCRQRYDVTLIRLTRRDRLRQAISFSRGIQTSQWTSNREKRGDEKYDFDQICRCYFLINRSYDYWKSYTDIIQSDAPHFVYEDLIDDPSPYVNYVADCLGEPHPKKMESSLKIQRDAKTEEWLVKFQADAKDHEFLESGLPSRLPARTLRNILRLIRKKPVAPNPYAY